MAENTIQYTARFKIRPGRVEEFKRVARDCVKLVKEQEPGTLDYRWFMDDRGKECIIQETFTNPEGCLAHLKGEVATNQLPRLLEASKLSSLEVYGEPRSADLRRALDQMGATYFGPAGGFTHLKAEPATQKAVQAELATAQARGALAGVTGSASKASERLGSAVRKVRRSKGRP